jgi:hypothetical protein
MKEMCAGKFWVGMGVLGEDEVGWLKQSSILRFILLLNPYYLKCRMPDDGRGGFP